MNVDAEGFPDDSLVYSFVPSRTYAYPQEGGRGRWYSEKHRHEGYAHEITMKKYKGRRFENGCREIATGEYDRR